MRFAPLLTFLVVIAGCDRSAPPVAPDPKIAALEAQVSALQTRIESLEWRESKLNETISTLSLLHPREAVFSPDKASYLPVVTRAGTFLVALETVAPYANGQRLTFRIGNPQSFLYRNPTVTLKWGKRAPEVADNSDGYLDAMAAWNASLRTKQERLLTNLPPGVWKEVTITVAPSTSEDVGHIEFSMEVSTVSMTLQ